MFRNGFGGLGASFPMRYGTPNSQNVMSDMEFGNDWQSRLEAIPKSFTQTTPIELTGSGYDPGKASRDYMGAMGSVNKTADSLGVVLNQDGTIAWNPYTADGGNLGSHVVGTQTQEFSNPEYDRMMQQYQTAMQQRQENQTAQQQAYNNMLGNYQENAVMGAGYANPNFGQVSGQSGSNVATPQQGVNMDWTSGMYNPSGTYGGGQNSGGWNF